MKFLHKNKASLLFFSILVITITAVIVFNTLYKVANVRIISDKPISLIGIEAFYGKNTVFLSMEEIRRSIFDNNPLVKKVQVDKAYPGTLVITIEKNQPFAYLLVDRGYFVLSTDGRILKKVSDIGSLGPVINYYQKLTYSSYQAGDVIDLEDILTALHFTETVEGLGLPVLGIDINGFNMIRLQLVNKMVFFTTEKEIPRQDYQLDTLIRQFKVEGRDFKSLDLRFDKPIIVLK